MIKTFVQLRRTRLRAEHLVQAHDRQIPIAEPEHLALTGDAIDHAGLQLQHSMIVMSGTMYVSPPTQTDWPSTIASVSGSVMMKPASHLPSCERYFDRAAEPLMFRRTTSHADAAAGDVGQLVPPSRSRRGR